MDEDATPQFAVMNWHPLLAKGDSYRVQRSIAALLNHLGGFLLLTLYRRVHFTG